jgi:hypothetical protein
MTSKPIFIILAIITILFNHSGFAQPSNNYLPKGAKTYLVNYGAIGRDLFRIHFAANQFTMIDEQSSPEGRKIRAINPSVPVLHYHCLVSAYPWFVYYNQVLNPDERCFMHSYDPAGLLISRQGTQTRISWAKDRRYSQLIGYRIRVSNDSNALGILLIDSIIKGRYIKIDSLLTNGTFLHIGTMTDSSSENWYSYATRINNLSLPIRHHCIDSIYSSTYASYRDTLRDTLFLRIRVDSTITADSVIAQIDLDHDRNPGEPNERFPLTYNPPFWTLFYFWNRNGYNAGTGFRIIIKFSGMIDTIPSAGYLMTTNVNNRLRSNPYGNELMNPCNSTWQNYSLDRITENLVGPDYSGVFCDNTTHLIQTWMYEVPKVYCYNDTTWKYGMIQFLDRVDSAAGANPVFFNGLGMTGSEVLLPSADGGMFEGWTLSNWGGYASESWWQTCENQVLNTRHNYHKIFLSLPQAPITDTLGRLFVYGSFLLTADDSVWFANADNYQIFAHFPEMNLALGKPLDTAYNNISELRHTNGYYVRPFEKGMVLVNPTNNPIILAGSYPNNLVVVSPATTIEGGRIYTVPFTGNQIGAKNALILLNSPLLPPLIQNVNFSPARPTDQLPNLIMAKVTGLEPLYVEASLEKILGPMHLVMNDSGFNGDTLAGDSVFTASFYLPIGVPAREESVRVLAYDTTGMVSVFKRTVRPAPSDSLNWVANWSFEYDIDKDNVPDFWRSYVNGFLYDTTGLNAVSGTRSVHISTPTVDSMYGIYQTIYLNQAVPEHVVLSGWSKASNVSGTRNVHYALYVDVRYVDSTPLYGQCALFDVGTHDWEYSSYRIQPTKRIWYLNLFCLFRYHSGEVWFDHISIEDALAPQAPILITPARDTIINNPFPLFDWTNVDWGVQYRIQVDDDSLFSSPVIDTIVSLSRFQTVNSLADGNYYWRVRAGDEVNRWSGWSAVWRFAIDTQAPNAPILLKPDSVATGIGLTPTFEWTPVTFNTLPAKRYASSIEIATKVFEAHRGTASRVGSSRRRVDSTGRPTITYQIQLTIDPNFTTTVFDTSVTTTTLVSSRSLANSTHYYWRVKARDDAGNISSYSARFEFTTAEPTWIAMANIPSGSSGKRPKSGTVMSGLDGKIYLLKASNTQDFHIYTPDAGLGTWTSDTMPLGNKENGDGKKPKNGAAMTAHNSAIYVLRGNNTLGFWQYVTIGESTGWHKLTNIPEGNKRPKDAAGLVAVAKSGNDYIFALKGSKTNEFYLFDIAANTWTPIAHPPTGASRKTGYKKGSCLTYDGNEFTYVLKGKYGDFFKYKVENDSWFELRPYDYRVFTNRNGKKKKIKDGAGLVYYNDAIYLLKGGNTNEFWKYEIANDTWIQLDSFWDIPKGGGKKVKAGGCLTLLGSDFYVAKGANTDEFYKHTPPTTALALMPNPTKETDGIMGKRVLISEFKFLITPNPAKNVFAIRYNLPVTRAVSFKLYNVCGAMVKSCDNLLPTKDGVLLIDTKTLASGVYILRFDSDEIKVTRKLVVEK